jgi:enoyl-CoA hydratase/carnithine racemase
MAANEAKLKADLIRTWLKGQVAYVQLNRPDKGNSYTQEMLDELEISIDGMEEDPSLRVIVVCSTGNRAFCGGADLGEMKGRDYRTALDLKSTKVFSRIASLSKVTLAAINGAAVGGGLELALACDIRIASENARFSLPEPTLGLIPAAGGTQRLPRLVGLARAKELILAGQVWEAEEALRYGLVSEVVKNEDLLAVAQRWGEQIAKGDPLALRLAKKVLDRQDFDGAGHNFESVVQALLYQLKLEK